MENNFSGTEVRDYLANIGVRIVKEIGNEIIVRCVFSSCDDDSRGSEAHLYFSAKTGQYHCKKCDSRGNLITLAKELGFNEAKMVQEIFNEAENEQKQNKTKKTSPKKITQTLIKYCCESMPPEIKEYLNHRGITDDAIHQYKLGYGEFYGSKWITIPIRDSSCNYAFFKLRQDPRLGNRKITWPEGAEAQIYDWTTLYLEDQRIVICEGELDRLLLLSKGIPAITSTHGAGTFKPEWIDKLQQIKNVYICFDNDEAGRNGAIRIAKELENRGKENVFIINLPEEVGPKGDITDYFIKLGGSADDLFNKYARKYPEKIDTSNFAPISLNELADILGLTIKHDNENKIATFLCQLSAFTEDSQFNISFNAPSSTGKSFIPLEIANLFPQDDVMRLGNCSPTAFFHEQGQYDQEANVIRVDLSRKIIIFTDMPHNDLLARMRSLLSHDEKEMHSKITDKNQRGGNRTKTVVIKGFPAVIFCTAGLDIDEQESTRFMLLSPEMNQDKISRGVENAIAKSANAEAYISKLNSDPRRKLLVERIKAIRQEKIENIQVNFEDKIKSKFLEGKKFLKPRHQRDVKRVMSLIKSITLLNLWWRERNGSTIIANEQDIEDAFKLWNKLSSSQEMNLPPYIYDIYKDILCFLWKEKQTASEDDLGISRKEILEKHFKVYARNLNSNTLRQQILPMLETTGLIYQEQDPKDKRKYLVYPVMTKVEDGNNSTDTSGVKTDLSETG